MTNSASSFRILLYGGYASKFLLAMQSILLFPVYVNFIGTDLLGYWVVTGGLVGWLAITEIGVTTVLLNDLSEKNSKKGRLEATRVFSASLYFFIFIAILIIVLGLILALNIDNIYDISNKYISDIRSALIIAVLALSLEIMSQYLATFHQAILRPSPVVFSLLISQIIAIVMIIILLNLGFGLVGIALGALIKGVINFFLLLRSSVNLGYFTKVFREDFSEQTRHLLYVSKFLVISKVSSSLVRNIEPVLLAFVLDPTKVLAYSVTQKSAVLCLQIINEITGAAFPSLSNFNCNSKNKLFDYGVEKTFIVVAGFSTIVFSGYIIFNEAFVTLWMGKSLYFGIELTIFTALSYVVLTWFNLSQSICLIKNKIPAYSFIVATEALSRFFLMIALIYLGYYLPPIASFFTIILATLYINHYMFGFQFFVKVSRPFLIYFLTLLSSIGLVYSYGEQISVFSVFSVFFIGTIVIILRNYKMVKYV